MNFFENAELKIINGSYCVQVLGRTVTLSREQQDALHQMKQPETQIVLGIRPEHLRLTQDGIAAQIEVSEMMGSEMHLHMTAGDSRVTAVIPTTGMETEILGGGKTVCIDLDPALCHLFYRESGENILQ